MPSSRTSRGRRPQPAANPDDATADGLAAADLPSSSGSALNGDDGVDSIINAGDCRIAVSVHIYEHLPDGRIVKLPRKNPRVSVHVDVHVHLHHCKPGRR